MSEDFYFGATRIQLVSGNPLDCLRSGLYVRANARGVMAAGLASDVRRAAGAGVESELRAQGPLLIRDAYLTSGGCLEQQGVTHIAHGIVTAEPGDEPRLDASIAALLAGLRLLEEAGCRDITIPQIGWSVPNLAQHVAAAELARVTITHLRRRSRLTDLSIVSRHEDYLQSLAAELSGLLRAGQGYAQK